jgi:hypothetical protein
MTHRKISETFLDFASPMLQTLPSPTTNEDIEKVLKIAFTVWNSVVYSDVKGDERYLAELRKNTSAAIEIEIIVNNLIIRKRSLFGDDQRLVGEYKVTMKKGCLNLWAEARTPNTAKDL